MADQQDLNPDFEASYDSTMKGLARQGLSDSRLDSWIFVEEVRSNIGADGYFPEWLLPYSAFVGRFTGDGNVVDEEDGLLKLRAAIMRAAQLGYTEGYFAGKDD